MKMTKVLAAALCALLAVSALSACNKKDEGNDVDSSDVVVNQPSDNGSEETTPESGISAYEWKHSDNEHMFTVGDTKIDFATYRYYAMNFKPQYDGGDESYWNEETEAQFKSDMLAEFKKLAAIETLSSTKGVGLTEDDMSTITDYIEQFKTVYGEDTYNQQLDLYYFTNDVYVNTNKYNLLLENLYETFADEDVIMENANKDYVHVKHVLVSTLDEEGKELTGAALDEKTALANDIAKKAREGADFDELVREYGEDPGMESSPEGYTFTYGTMVQEFEDMSYSLKVGEISDPVKTSYGYHIIQKLPLDKTVILDNESTTYWEILSAIAAAPTEAAVAELAETLEVSESDAFKGLTMTNIGARK